MDATQPKPQLMKRLWPDWRVNMDAPQAALPPAPRWLRASREGAGETFYGRYCAEAAC